MLPILSDFWFLIVLLAVFTVPGWFLLSAFFDPKRFTLFEWAVLAVASSLASLDFLLLTLFYVFHLHLTTLSVGAGLIVETALWAGWAFRRHGSFWKVPFLKTHFSPREYQVLLLILLLTFGIKTAFLSSSVAPSATDLGHHMYWARVISETGSIPDYTKRDILTQGDQYQLGNPEPIADFIIGEHLPFVALRLLTGADYLSAFPIVTLFCINVLSILTLFVLAWRLFVDIDSTNNSPLARRIALFTLLIIGPVYALSSPQAKFVSGGVVGNTIGNLFIPLLWLVYFRALKEKDSALLTLGFFLTFGLVYTHHLSTLMFLFGLFFTLIFLALLRPRHILKTVTEWFRLGWKPAPLLFALAAILFFFLVIPPSYADPKAIGTAVGSPTKTTRIGLPFLALTVGTVGLLRMALGLAGLFLLATLLRTRRITRALLLGWTGSLLLLSLRPQWAFINIPSDRVATYTIFPLALLAAFSLALCFDRFRVSLSNTSKQTIFPLSLSIIILFSWSALLLGNGFFDNSKSLTDKNKDQSVVETLAASRFLADTITPADLILKDHNYIVGDSWIKHFFLRDYNFPLSRGYFKRYEDATKDRERCTLRMISTPNTEQGRRCYDDLHVSYVMINPHYDRKQFDQSPEFSLVYLSDNIAVYHRK